LYKHITQRVSTEIESSECFAKKVTIFNYTVNIFTNRALPNNKQFNSDIIYDVKYVLWPV